MATRAAARGKPAARAGDDTCELCFGSGWRVVRDGKGAGTAVPCECRGRRRVDTYLALAGIPERYRGCRIDNFNVASTDPAARQLLKRAREVSRQYVDSFFDVDAGRFRRAGLLYIGRPGTGKTHLAAAVLAELIRRYSVRGRFVDFTTLLHQIQATFDDGAAETKASVLEPVIQAEVLVLDELGAQKPTEWVMDTLYLIMNSRYSAGRPTLFTTNYRLDEPPENGDVAASASGELSGRRPVPRLSDRLSAPLVSRLYEMAQPLVLDGADYRREVKMHQHRIGG